MKRIAALILATISFLVVGCGSESVIHVGVNAEVLEISNGTKIMVVKGLDENGVLGERCSINCENESVAFIYADFATGQTVDLEFDDFAVGDVITVDVGAVENKYAATSRIQLLTQRN